jgi:hypothetical protein
VYDGTHHRSRKLFRNDSGEIQDFRLRFSYDQAQVAAAILWKRGNEMKSKTCKFWLPALIATLFVPAFVFGQSGDNDGCSNATLSGDYAFRVSGQVYPPVPPGAPPVVIQRDGVAMTHFDGAGKLTQVDFVVSNGSPLPGPTDPVTGFHIFETGTYQVFPDCTGTAEIKMPTPPGGTSGAVIDLKFVLAKQGKTIHTIVSRLIPPNSTTPMPASIHSDAEKQGQD